MHAPVSERMLDSMEEYNEFFLVSLFMQFPILKIVYFIYMRLIIMSDFSSISVLTACFALKLLMAVIIVLDSFNTLKYFAGS